MPSFNFSRTISDYARYFSKKDLKHYILVKKKIKLIKMYKKACEPIYTKVNE